MSSVFDISMIRDNYKKMSDEELMYAAMQDAGGLTDEAQAIIKEELISRKLDVNLLKGVDAQNREYPTQEIDNYCYIIQKLDCPLCSKSFETLNATVTGEVMSFIFFTHYNKKLKIACPKCLNKANNNAIIKSVLLGWWGIPHGIIKTIQAISFNTKNKRTNNFPEPNIFLRNYVKSNIGLIEMYKNDKDKLQKMISGL